MAVWLCRWPNEENPDTRESAREYLREGGFVASNGDVPSLGDLVFFRTSVNMRDAAGDETFSTFATARVSDVTQQQPDDWEFEPRMNYLRFVEIQYHEFAFEAGAFAIFGHGFWPNTPPNQQFMMLNPEQLNLLRL